MGKSRVSCRGEVRDVGRAKTSRYVGRDRARLVDGLTRSVSFLTLGRGEFPFDGKPVYVKGTRKSFERKGEGEGEDGRREPTSARVRLRASITSGERADSSEAICLSFRANLLQLGQL